MFVLLVGFYPAPVFRGAAPYPALPGVVCVCLFYPRMLCVVLVCAKSLGCLMPVAWLPACGGRLFWRWWRVMVLSKCKRVTEMG